MGKEELKPANLNNLIIGQEVFWRWHGSKTAFSEEVVLGVNGNMVALGCNQYSNITSWLHRNEIDLIVKDMSK